MQAPTLIVIGDMDIITPQHALEMRSLIAHSQLAVVPGGHGEYIGEITTLGTDNKVVEVIVPLLERFLDREPGIG